MGRAVPGRRRIKEAVLHPDVAISMFEQVPEQLGGLMDEALESFAAGQIAAQGPVEDARRHVDGARAELDTYDERSNEPIALLAEGALAHADAGAASARRLVERAAEVTHEQGSCEIATRARATLAALD